MTQPTLFEEPTRQPPCSSSVVVRQSKAGLAAASPLAEPVPDAASAPAPAGPRSVAARIIELARALGVRSDAEAKSDLPF